MTMICNKAIVCNIHVHSNLMHDTPLSSLYEAVSIGGSRGVRTLAHSWLTTLPKNKTWRSLKYCFPPSPPTPLDANIGAPAIEIHAHLIGLASQKWCPLVWMPSIRSCPFAAQPVCKQTKNWAHVISFLTAECPSCRHCISLVAAVAVSVGVSLNPNTLSLSTT